MNTIRVGESAPSFELKDQNGTVRRSSDMRGSNALLSFHPLAWTSVCQRQMESLEMNTAVFKQLNTVAFGISVDSSPCKKAWAESMRLQTTLLLADFWPHGELAQSFGLFRHDAGTSERANVIIDSKGVVRWIKIYPIRDLPDVEEVIQVLREMDA